jgi:DNA-binding NarL/FixJ family response regulator
MLVDDNVQFLQAAHDYLARGSNVHIVAIARSGEEAVRKAEVLKPDIVFMDISMPGMNGFETARRIKHIEYPPHVVMLTLHNSIDYRCHSTAAGADAYLLKDQFASEIFSVIEAMTESRHLLSQPSSARPLRKSRPRSRI